MDDDDNDYQNDVNDNDDVGEDHDDDYNNLNDQWNVRILSVDISLTASL